MSKQESRKRQVECDPAKPPCHPPVRACIPLDLLARGRWVAWHWRRKAGRWTKVPLSPHCTGAAKTNDPATWGTYDQAYNLVKTRAADGVGFVFAPGDGLVGIDVDDCRDPDTGTLTEAAWALVERLGTYAEVSPTGTGIKLFAEGYLPAGVRNKGNGVEVYAERRYFTVTGRVIAGAPQRLAEVSGDVLAELTGSPPPTDIDDIDAAVAEVTGTPRPVDPPTDGAPVEGAPDRGEFSTDPPPPRRLPQMVMPPQVKRPAPVRMVKLWAGDWTGYPSQSEADLALLGYLSRYSGDDAATLDHWFRISGLYRAKWDEPHFADGSTYGAALLRMTLANVPRAGRLVTTLASEVTPQPVAWLWPGFVAYGCLTVIDGDPGLGKSTLTAELAARLSTGRPLPGGSPMPPAAALIASCEDSAAHTLVPRLAACGADRAKVRLLLEAEEAAGGLRGLQLPDDLPLIERHLIDDGAKLLVLDPLMALLGKDRNGRPIDAHRDQSVRMLLAEFKLLAERTGAAVVVVRHLNKAAGGAAVYRGSGSIGITGAARSVLLVARHPDDGESRVVAVVESNLGPRPLSRAFRLTGDGPAVAWGGECEVYAEDVLVGRPAALPPQPVSREAEAAAWLADALADGPRAAVELRAEAEARGWGDRLLTRARHRLGATTVKTADGWEWHPA